MKRCLECQSIYSSSKTICPSCNYRPTTIGDYITYAPNDAVDGNGFKIDSFTMLAGFEERNFWFRSRNKLIIWALQNFCPSFSSFLEIGCGTGYVLSEIANKFPSAQLNGSDLFTEGLEFAANRASNAKLMQLDARNIPFYEEFDVIGAFDVLEHIEEDEVVLKQLHSALKPSGFIIITVPQHAWLWSAVDEYSCHARRYSAEELSTKFGRAGFSIIKTTSFVTTLLPAMFVSRIFKRNQTAKTLDPTKEFNISPFLNQCFFLLLLAEFKLIKLGLTFPVGGSRLVIAQKK